MHFLEWEAAVAAGATVDELFRLEQYPTAFRAKLIAWFGAHNQVRMHQEDAAREKMKRAKK